MLSGLPNGLGTLERIEVFEGKVELATPVGAAHGVHRILPKLFVRVCGSEGEGWGEVAAIDDPVGSDPSLDEVRRHLNEVWVPRVLHASTMRAHGAVESHAISMLGGSSVLDQVTSAALEMAVLDAELRAAALPLRAWLGVEASGVPYGAVVGMSATRDVSEMASRAERLVQEGASRLRIKVQAGFAVEPLRAIRERLPEVVLQADANGSFEIGDLEELSSLDAFNLVCLEQPLSGRDFAEVARVASLLSTPVCLDESIISRRSATDALRYGAASVLCLKPARIGGLRPTMAVLETMVRAQGSCFLGGMFETGLGRAFLGALASRPEVGLISDVAAPSTYLVHDPCGLDGPLNGVQPLWDAPGVGPWPEAGQIGLLGSKEAT